MTHPILEKYFSIKGAQPVHWKDGYETYIYNGFLYSILMVTHVEQETMEELYEMSEHLVKEGDRYVATFVLSKQNKFLVTEKDQDFVLLKAPLRYAPSHVRFGRKLGKLHRMGRSIQKTITATSRMGQWKDLWSKRLQQMENVWNEMVREHPNTPFTKYFVESFPYYLGLTETAIQYLVDTEIDDKPLAQDAGTICHEHFYDDAWGKKYWIHHPFDWVFDHASRDLSEWVRGKYFRFTSTFHPDVEQFFGEYQTVNSLSSFSWRLLYARLLFPLHYFECIEEYFLVASEQKQKQLEEQLEKYLRYSTDYERFLSSFYHVARVPLRKYKIPTIKWLGKPVL
jgi:spore coat protein YutH